MNTSASRSTPSTIHVIRRCPCALAASTHTSAATATAQNFLVIPPPPPIAAEMRADTTMCEHGASHAPESERRPRSDLLTSSRLPGPAYSSAEMPAAHFDFDFIVIGSGFGGSVAACRLAEKGYRVAVMEMGRRWTPGTLPRTSWYLHRWFWSPKIGFTGFFGMRYFRHVTILHGCAVGGGSITYATTSLRPPEKIWHSGAWSGLAQWQIDMPRFYETASTMLGVTRNSILGPSDELLRRSAHEIGVHSTFYK